MKQRKTFYRQFGCLFLAALLATGLLMGGQTMKVQANGTWENYSNTWVMTDALGRSTPAASETGPVKSDKYVAIFYHIWHNNFMAATVGTDRQAPRNVTQIIKQNENALHDSSVWGPNITYHYWGEPLFGYYDLSKDDYVIRKHAQMLTDAGIDAIIIDYSNYYAGGTHDANSYTKASLQNLLDVFAEIREEGGDTPGVALLLTWNAAYNGPAIERFYKDFYSKEKYQDLWFLWEGKPLILAQDTAVPEEIKDFFTYRKPHPYYTPVTEANAWPWLSLYPQEPGYTEQNPCEIVTVGVAQNWSDSLDFMSATDEEGNFIARGRSYTVGGSNKLLKDPTSDAYGSEYGANLQQQFDRAIELDPSMIFITGWNEWIAARFTEIPDWAASSKKEPMASGGFCDVFTTEFSRDAEPTREGKLADNFYNQLVANIRRYKGTGVQNAQSQSKTISVDGDFSQWDEIGLEYRDDVGDISVRDAKGIGKNTYTNDTGRNDFRLSKVTYDSENIYFYVQTEQAVTAFTDAGWMNLLLQVSPENPNWEGFDFIVNRSNVRDGLTTLERSTGGWNWEVVSDTISYQVSGTQLHLAIPRSALNLAETESISFHFKWMDHMQTEGDAMEFYLNGDCAPNERFCYHFTSKSIAEQTATPAPASKEDGKSSGSLNGTALPGVIGAGILAAAACITGIVLHKKKNKGK